MKIRTETDAEKGIRIVLETLKKHGMTQKEAQQTVFDMQKAGIEITFSVFMLGTFKEPG